MEHYAVNTADVIAWRRHIHAHPELSFEEHETAQFVEEKLRSFGVETTRGGENRTAVIGRIHGTKPLADGEKAKTVLLRADMDALPLSEATGEEFSSTVEGVCHACGHDAHTAMLLGAAQVLAEHREDFAGTVVLCFQHAEEKNPGGAIELVKEGVTEGVDAAFGIHVMNEPLGKVSICKGQASTSAGGAFITFHGTGAHGSMPHKGHDPLLAAAQAIVALNTITSRNTDPSHTVIVNVGTCESSTKAPNVIGDWAKIGVSIRTLDDNDYALCVKRVTTICESIAQACECTVEFGWVDTYPIIYNDDAVCDIAYQAINEAMPGVAFYGPGTSASEDFSHIAREVPSCFMFLGAGSSDEGYNFVNHHPSFTINEECLEIGVRCHVATALGVLQGINQ